MLGVLVLDAAKCSFIGKSAKVPRLALQRLLRGRNAQIPNRLVQTLSFAGLLISFLMCGGLSSAQTPPIQVIAYQDSLGVFVNYSHCPSSEYQNCDANFGLYRNPSPGFNQSPVKICWVANGNSTFDTCKDDTAQAGQTYTYQVCTGGAAVSDRSNCATSNSVTVPKSTPPPPPPTVTLSAAVTSITKGQETDLRWSSTNATSLDLEPSVGKVNAAGITAVAPAQTTTYTLTAKGPGGQNSASVTISVPCLTPWAAPTNAGATGSLSDVPLKWTNPNTNAGQTCPAPPGQVLIYRMGANGWQQIAALEKAGNGGTLPGHYTDSDLLQPHTGYEYEVCEGGAPNWQFPNNCASPPGVQHGGTNYGTITWGADPVLSAARVNATSVRLKLALDQYTVTSIVITRQGSDDPCRQGGTLGNGLQGCPTVGPNGGSPAQTVTVYSWTAGPGSQYPPGFENKQTAPFVIDLPDDTAVKPGVEYYYLAHVTWLWSVAQDSNTVTVPNAYSAATSQQGFAGLTALKPNGSPPPPPQPQSSSPAVAMVGRKPPTISPAPSSMMRPAGSSLASAPAQVTATTPMMTPATPMLQSSTGASSGPLLAQPATGFSAARAAPITGNLKTIINQVQQKPHDAQALYSLGKAYCAGNARNTGVSYLYMALLLAEQSGNAPLAIQIKTTLAEQGASTR